MADVDDNPSLLRFEIHDDGKLAGFAQYVRRPGRIFFVHTEIDPAFEGKGLAGQLVRFALDDARSTGRRIQPSCSYVAAWIQRHPEYQDLVAA